MERMEEGKAVGAEAPTPSSVRFRINGMPESMNSIYQIIFAQRRVMMKPDVLRYKTQAKLMMPPWKTSDNELFGIKMRFHHDWYFKKGTIRRVDLSNLEKVICDATAEKYGFDDARIFEKYSWKVQSGQTSFVEVEVYRLDGDALVGTGATR